MTVKPGWARKRDRLRRREPDAASASAARPPADTATLPADTAGSPWALSPAEWRLLVITFVGGLGSIVAGACIIGGALAIARQQEKYGGLKNAFLTTALMTLLCAPALLLATRGPDSNRVNNVLRLLLLVLCVGALFLVLLIWIGVAAGIH